MVTNWVPHLLPLVADDGSVSAGPRTGQGGRGAWRLDGNLLS